MDITALTRLYNPCEYTIIKEIKNWDDAVDKRYVFVLAFADGTELALKVCRNTFTTTERVAGWQRLAAHYLSLGILPTNRQLTARQRVGDCRNRRIRLRNLRRGAEKVQGDGRI